MKVKCIDDSEYLWITINKLYDVIKETEDRYFIVNDLGVEWDFHKTRFEIVEEKDDKGIKELTLQEVFNYQYGTEFEMSVCGNRKQKVRLTDYELIIIEGYKKDSYVTKVYNLKALLEAKFYLVEQWKEIDYYTAYTTSSSNIKYINDDEEIIGTHYHILTELDSKCSVTGEDLSRLLADAKWYAKVV